MRSPLRVVVLDHTARLGGAELALARALDAVDPREAQVRAVLFEDGPLTAVLRRGGHPVEIRPLAERVARQGRALGALGSAASTAQVAPFVVALAARLRRLRPDVVHTTSLKADLIGLAAARVVGLPVVWHVHDRIADDYLPGPVVSAFRTVARRGPAVVVANSSATAATLPGARRLTVVHPGLSPEQILPGSQRREHPEGMVVGIVGRISPTKGQLDFVRAAAEILRVHPEARFEIIGAALFGEEAYEAQVRAEVERLGLGAVVTFAGFSSRVSDVLDRLSVCVHASAQPEPFGQVVVEAMARRVPVVATSAGAVPEILDGGRLGYLAHPGDPHDLAATVLRALADPRSEEVTDAAWLEVTTRYTAARTAAGLLEAWRAASGT